MNIIDFFKKKPSPSKDTEKPIPPGRISYPSDDGGYTYIGGYTNLTQFVDTPYDREVLELIRKLFKVNPDVSIAVQDMFKLANVGFTLNFPNNTDKEIKAMQEYLNDFCENCVQGTAGLRGFINKLAVQAMVTGAISIEVVPKNDLSGVETIVMVDPEDIIFKRSSSGKYLPYQRAILGKSDKPIPLNPATYLYLGIYSDKDEPYGIPPFLAALSALKTQHEMKINMKHIMDIMGLVGFLEGKIDKPGRRQSESEAQYVSRLEKLLVDFKRKISKGLKDGVVVGFKEDHEFKLNSTTQNLQNIEKPWGMNQQSVANGLGVNGNLIGLQTITSEAGAGILLSKMISQLSNIQIFLSYSVKFIINLALKLKGFNNKGVEVIFNTSTISDELKVQQGKEYKIRNLLNLYNQGIISQKEFARQIGYTEPDEKEPRLNQIDPLNPGPDREREKDKDDSDRRTRDKDKTNPKRRDNDTRKP